MYLLFHLRCLVRATGPRSVRKLLIKAVFHDALGHERPETLARLPEEPSMK